MKKPLILFFCVFLVLPCISLRAFDIGLVLDQSPAFSGSGSDSSFDYQAILIPRAIKLLDDRGRIFVSGALNFQNDPWNMVPEILRTEFSWRLDNGEFRAGRIQYSDPSGYIAGGLFDGAHISLDTEAGNFGAGVWYTGLLYKKRANITMTDNEQESYFAPIKYSDFADTYFAPKRIVAALDWEHPAIMDVLRVKAGILGQVDLSDDKLHTQYAVARFTLPVEDFVFDLGASLGLIQNSGDFGIALAGELGISWLLPTLLEDRLLLLGRFSSGTFEDSTMQAFLPITTSYQGNVLRAKLSGLSMIHLDYLARFHRTFSASISSSYFIRSDLGTFTLLGNEGWFLGNEFFGRLMWSPVSDMQVNFGGGVFLPSMGNAAPDADILWRIELNVVLSLY